MTVSLRKAAATQLEAEYSQLRKEQAAKANNPNQARSLAAKNIAGPQTDTVTLSSKQDDSETYYEPQSSPSQPVTMAEKAALQFMFSVSA